MQAGRLDRRISLQRPSASAGGAQNAMGEAVPGWTTYATVSASFRPISDGERLRADQVGASATARFQIRWSRAVAGVNPTQQLMFEGVPYGITGVKELGRREGLEITAVALADRPLP